MDTGRGILDPAQSRRVATVDEGPTLTEGWEGTEIRRMIRQVPDGSRSAEQIDGR